MCSLHNLTAVTGASERPRAKKQYLYLPCRPSPGARTLTAVALSPLVRSLTLSLSPSSRSTGSSLVAAGSRSPACLPPSLSRSRRPVCSFPHEPQRLPRQRENFRGVLKSVNVDLDVDAALAAGPYVAAILVRSRLACKH